VTELSVSVSPGDREGGCPTVVKLVGEADTTNRQALAEVLAAETGKKPPRLLLDISGLAFIDSAALHEIIRAHRALRSEGCQMALVSPTHSVTRILQLSGIDQVIPVQASDEEARTL
jgi:anti-sigma B factor antagonist